MDKGIEAVTIAIGDFLGTSLPALITGISDLVLLPVRLVLALIFGD